MRSGDQESSNGAERRRSRWGLGPWKARALAAFAMLSVAWSGEAHAETRVQSMSLQSALAMARSRTAEVRAAIARSRAAEAEADAALAGYLPNLAGQAGGGQVWARTTTPGALIGQPADRVDRTSRRSTDVAAAVRWTPFDFGQTPNLVGAARADARASMYRALATYNETARQVATAYLNVVYDELLVDNAKTSVQIRERHAAIVRGQVASGVRTTVDEGRARVEFEAARLEQTTTLRQTQQDKARLATILLMPATTGFKLTRPAVPGVPDEASKLAGTAIEHRPEVFASNNDVVAREDSLSAARLARLPTVGTSLELADRSSSGDPDLSVRSLSALVTVTIPIFDWAIWGRIPVAENTLAAAEADRAGTLARVQGEAAIAAFGLQAARQLLDQSKSVRDLAGATLAVLEARFQAGLATTTDLFDAAARDADARRGMIRAELDLAVATVDALAATGRMSELER